MNENLKKELNDAIRKSLPEQLAGEFKVRFAELEKKEQELDSLQEKHNQLERTLEGAEDKINSLIAKVNDYEKETAKFEEKKKDLIRLEENLRLREINLENQILLIKLEESEKRNDGIMELSRVVFRNANVQRSIYNTETTRDLTQSVYDPSSGRYVDKKNGISTDTNTQINEHLD